jgi:hypothetical protein
MGNAAIGNDIKHTEHTDYATQGIEHERFHPWQPESAVIRDAIKALKRLGERDSF